MIGEPPFFAGYIQRLSEPLREVTMVEVKQEYHPNGLVKRGQIKIEPGNFVADVEPAATGAPVPFARRRSRVALSGSQVKVVTSDGRKGKGWVEWNTVQKPALAN
jgi:hypothetical protein